MYFAKLCPFYLGLDNRQMKDHCKTQQFAFNVHKNLDAVSKQRSAKLDPHSYMRLTGNNKVMSIRCRLWTISLPITSRTLIPPRKCGSNFKTVTSEQILQITFMSTSCTFDIANCIGKSNDLVPWANMLSPEPILTQMYVVIWHHCSTLT